MLHCRSAPAQFACGDEPAAGLPQVGRLVNFVYLSGRISFKMSTVFLPGGFDLAVIAATAASQTVARMQLAESGV